MRYSKQISTGHLIESQSGGNPDNPLHLSTMVDNAVNSGVAKDDVEVGYCTNVEIDDMIASAVTPLQKWKNKMAESDGPLPRWAEDLIDGAISSQTQKLADDKKALRATKP